MNIKKIKSDEALIIIEERLPLGLYYSLEKNNHGENVYICIDNLHGDAWVEEFKSLSACKRWLRGF